LKIEADPSYQPEPPAGPWDTTFNRAMNEYKGRGKRDAPTSAGRVTGFGTAMKFTEYYSTDTEKKKARRYPAKDRAEVVELRKQLSEKVDSSVVDKLVADKVDERLRSFLPPALVEGITAWHAGGQQGPIYVPSFAGSTSSNNVSPVLQTQPVPATVEQHTPTPENNDRPAAGTGASPSPLAEINAVTKVIN